jgi:hypothetical protein
VCRVEQRKLLRVRITFHPKPSPGPGRGPQRVAMQRSGCLWVQPLGLWLSSAGGSSWLTVRPGGHSASGGRPVGAGVEAMPPWAQASAETRSRIGW